jgi:hypothetical protein
MKSIKCLVGLIFSVGLCAIAAWFEFNLVLQFGNVLSFFTGAFFLVTLLAALWQAPEGYEDTSGFRI